MNVHGSGPYAGSMPELPPSPERAVATGVSVIGSASAMRRQVATWRGRGGRIGLVPTMGALHRGHLALVDEASRRCDHVVVTVYVNPLQFGHGEDFAEYPRQIESDLEHLSRSGCDALFAPSDAEIFPGLDDARNMATRVSVGRLANGLCGPFRPGHFDGVATEVTKFLLIVLADDAFFGEKDFQQLRVVQQLARDLNVPTIVRSVPTVREPDGLALSSRNDYLSRRQRRVAHRLYSRLMEAASAVATPGADLAGILEAGHRSLLKDGFDVVDYFELVDAADLRRLTAPTADEARLLAAVRLGPARLIDNVAVAFG